MCTPTQTWHTHLYEYDYLWKRYNGTVGCPLKGSASLMRCAAVWVCGCVYMCGIYTNMCEGVRTLFTQWAPVMRSDTSIWCFLKRCSTDRKGRPPKIQPGTLWTCLLSQEPPRDRRERKRDRFEKEWSKSIQSADPTFTITQLDSIF